VEAKNLVNLTNQQTPLIGGLNDGVNDQGYTPNIDRETLKTPNIILDQISKIKSTPLSTPIRDSLNINETDIEESLIKDKSRIENIKMQLIENLAKLPKPKNDKYYFKTTSKKNNMDVEEMEEDVSDKIKKKNMLKKKKEEEVLLKSTKVAQMNLPKPNILKIKKQENQYNLNDEREMLKYSQQLINNEFVKLVEFDKVMYNEKNELIKENINKNFENFKIDEFKISEINNSKTLIEVELNNFTKFLPTFDEFSKFYDESLSKNRDNNILNERISKLYEEKLNSNNKLIKKLTVLTNGYKFKTNSILSEIQKLFSEIKLKESQLISFQSLRDNELLSIPKRLNEMKELLQKELDIEKKLQSEYSRLQNIYEDFNDNKI
jgi:hypothetical protein